MLAVAHQRSSVKCEVIKFKTKLQKYLDNYDVKFDDFRYEEELTDLEIKLLEEYYKESYAKAVYIHDLDEITYNSFKNLDEISKVIKKYNLK